MAGINIETIPEVDKLILEEWKVSTSMKYDDLKFRLEQNIVKRSKTN